MVKTWKDEQISLDPIKNETIAVIGYGIQGSAQASNMKDSGLNVIVGLNKGGKSWAKAESDGHTVFEVSEACAKADIDGAQCKNVLSILHQTPWVSALSVQTVRCSNTNTLYH